jgi:hypothetical protein
MAFTESLETANLIAISTVGLACMQMIFLIFTLIKSNVDGYFKSLSIISFLFSGIIIIVGLVFESLI